MAINKFQRSRLTFELSAKSPINRLKHSFLRNHWANRTEIFYMKTPYDRLAKIYTNCSGHMTKMATMLIYSKTI